MHTFLPLTLRQPFVNPSCRLRVSVASESHRKDTANLTYRQGILKRQLHNTAQLKFCTQNILIFSKKCLYLQCKHEIFFYFLEPVARGDEKHVIFLRSRRNELGHDFFRSRHPRWLNYQSCQSLSQSYQLLSLTEGK